MNAAPLIPLYKYQRDWLADTAYLKSARWSRDVGKTWTCALGIIVNCEENEARRRPVPWFHFSGSDAQTLESIRLGAIHAQAMGIAYQAVSEEIAVEKQTFVLHKVEFEHGSRFVGLPTNILTIRGRHGNLWWDEAGTTPHAKEIYRAAMPIASEKGRFVMVTGTPGPPSGPFFEIQTGILPGWSLHVVDVHRAIREGRQIDLEKVYSMVGRGRNFRTEYLVEFEEEDSRFIELELIYGCEDPDTLEIPFVRIDAAKNTDWKGLLDPNLLEGAPSVGYDAPKAWERLFAPLRKKRRPLYLGFDVARRAHLAVIWIVEVDGFFRRTRAVIAFHDRRWAEMEAALTAAIDCCVRACIDTGGMGEQLGERFVEKFGAHRVEDVNFSSAGVKEDLAARMLRGYEDRTHRIPPAREIRDSIHSVYKEVTKAGHVRYDANATEEAGHADYFWAQSLALLAAGDGVQGVPFMKSFGKPRMTRANGVM